MCKPHGWQITNTHAKRISVAILPLGALISVPYVIINGRHTKDTPRHGIIAYECSEDDSYTNTIWPVVNNSFFLLLFTVSFLVLLILYQRIVAAVWKQRKRFRKCISSLETATNSSYNHEELQDGASTITGPEIQNVPHGPEKLQIDDGIVISSNRKCEYLRTLDDCNIRNHETMKNQLVTRQFLDRDNWECENDMKDGSACHIIIQNQARSKPRLSCEFSGHLSKVAADESKNDFLPNRQTVNVEKEAKFVSNNSVGAYEAELIKYVLNNAQTSKEANMKLQGNYEFADHLNRVPETEITHNSLSHTETQNVTMVKHCGSMDLLSVDNKVCETNENHETDFCLAIPSNTTLKSLETTTFDDAFTEACKADIQDGSDQFQNEERTRLFVTGHSPDCFDKASEAPNNSAFPYNLQCKNSTSFDTRGNFDVVNAAFDTHIQNDCLCETQNETGTMFTLSLNGEMVDSIKKLSEIRLAYGDQCNVQTPDQTNGTERFDGEFIGHSSEVSGTELKNYSSCNSQIKIVALRTSRPTSEFSDHANDAAVTWINDSLNVKNQDTSKHELENDGLNVKNDDSSQQELVNHGLNVKNDDNSKHKPQYKGDCQAKATGTYRSIASRINIPRFKAQAHPGVNHTRTMHENNATAIVIAITAIYCICFLPYFAMSLYHFLAPDAYDDMSLTEDSIYNFFDKLYFINSVANPIVNSLLGSNFRRACRKLFRFRSREL